MLKMLLDTDIGNDMDDMQALAYLLAREDAELVGITTVTGEADVRAKLADAMCRLAGKDRPGWDERRMPKALPPSHLQGS